MRYFFIFLFVLHSASYSQTSIGKEFQNKADTLREAGETLKAIDLYNQAIVAYQKEGNQANIFFVLNGRLHAWKHLYYLTEDPLYAIFVKKDAETINDFAKSCNMKGKDHTIHYLLATADHLQKNYPSAEKHYQQAVELYPRDHPEKGDWMAHLGESMIRNGKKEEGKQMAFKGIGMIKEKPGEIDSFLLNVWLSGAYLRLAKVLKKSDPEESLLLFEKAKEIIDKDSRLIIRKRQLEKFDES